jgi:hypothetical protein
MGRGDVFPPILVSPIDAGTVAMACGNHRYAACVDQGRPTHPAYIVEGDRLTLLRIRVEDNARHGQASTKAERIDHASALMELGMSQSEASKVVALDAPVLSIALTVRAGEKRAHDMDVPDQFFRLSEMARYTVSQVADDTVFEALAGYAASAAPKLADLKDLTRAVKVAPVDEALRLIGAEAEESQQRSKSMAGGVRAPSRSPRAVFDTSLTSITALKPAEIAASCPNADVAGVLADKLMKAAAVLAEAHQLLVKRAADTDDA